MSGLTGREVIFLIAVNLKMLVELTTFTVIPYMIGEDLISIVFKIFSYTSYLIAVLTLFLVPRLTVSEIARIFILLGITAIGSYFSGNEVFLTLIFIYGAKDLDLEKIFRITGSIYIIYFLLTIFAALTGIIENWDFMQEAIRPRWAVGYTWPTYTSSVLFMAILIFCYLKKDRLNLIWVAVLELFNFWLFTYTDSRAGMALAALVPIVFYLLKLKKNNMICGKAEQVAKWAFPIFAVLVFAIVFLYDGSGFLEKLNLTLSRRLSYAQTGLADYGVHLFGQKIEWAGWGGIGHVFTKLNAEYNFVDISYVKLLLENGIIVWLAIMAGWTMASLKAYKQGKRYLVWALFFIALYCTVEQWMINIGMNPFLIFTACILYKNEKAIVQEKG